MKKKLLIPLLLGGLTLSAQSFAQEDDAGLLGEDFKIEYDAEINTNVVDSKHDSSGVNLNGSYVSLSVEWKEKIRMVLTGKLEELFQNNKVEFNDDFDVEKFVEEAYIEIREVGGTPIAIIVGKQPIPFGQNVQAMPMFASNPLANLQEIDEVFGLTVDLTEGLLGLFDQVELSTFETRAGDLEIGRIDGMSIRMSKMLTEQWLLTLSHAELGNNHLNSGEERRTSVGLIGETEDGSLVGWVEGILFSNNPEYPNSKFAITVGGQYQVSESTAVVVEYNYIQDEMHEIGAGVKTELTRNLSVGAEVRYRDYVTDRDNDVLFGIVFTYKFGNTGYSENENYLFGSEE
ncbi:DUF5777 family beta-barrel protein [Halobacteriovorax sp. HLS]|uniref:DUF5777 family beta-barrel protein n=1 Tax=Halobacteriovorax sp. HLS TaxID=2234000 RepID=UPI000FD9423D|nr:DUF5777 family beta-barrel protein [Halobacteriovorax sp. HLS]